MHVIFFFHFSSCDIEAEFYWMTYFLGISDTVYGVSAYFPSFYYCMETLPS